MAVEEEVLLDISVQNRDALANIAQLSKANEDLKSSLDELKKAYKDGSDATDENIKQRAILEAQIKENNAGIRENSKEIKTNAANVASAADSINGMRARVADLTKSWNSLSAEAREGDVGRQIQAELGALNEGINAANVSVNNFKDNIGNYPSDMGKVGIANTKVGQTMEKLGISSNMSMKQMAQSVVEGTRAAGAAFAKLLLNPVVAFLAAIVAASTLLVKAFQKNDEATTNLERAFAQFKPIIEGISWVFDKLAVGVSNLILGFSKMAGAVLSLIPGYKKSAEAAEELVVAQDKLEESERKYLVAAAERNLEIAKIKKDAVDTQKFTDKEIQDMLKRADDLALQNLEEDKARKAETLRLLEEKAKWEINTSDATRNAITAARVAMIQADEAYFTETTRLASKANAAAKRIEDENAARAKEAQRRAEERRRFNEERRKREAEEQAAADAIVEKIAFDSIQKILAAREAALKAVTNLKLKIQEEEEDISDITQYVKDLEDAKLSIRLAGYQNQFDMDRSFLDAEFQMKIANAKRIGASTVTLEKQYAEEKKKIAKAQTGAQLDFASGLMGNLAELFGENTKAGKLAAVAQIAIDTYKGSMAAWASAQAFPAPFNVIAGGAAVAATVAMGMKSAKAVYAVKSGLKGDSSGGSANFSGVNTAGSVASSNMTSTPAFNTLYQTNADTVETAQVISSSQPNPIVRVSEINEVQNSVAVKENSKI